MILFKNVYPSSFDSLTIPANIQIKLSNKDYNNYLRKGMRAFADSEIDGKGNIKKKYKKWVDAEIITKNGPLNSKIRIMGDWKDHLRLPMTSIKVKINDSSYNGVTRFNLFLPHTRKGENEVFWSLMLSKLKFPVLYTRMINVNFNGNRYKAIFQEDATKEFLERNGITETAILKKNDFGFYLNNYEKDIYQKNFTSSYVIDNNNFLKNEVAGTIISDAISLLSDENPSNRIINESFYKKIMSDYSDHGLADINRKYIYQPSRKMFIPLYYDGNIEFPPNKANCKSQISEHSIMLNFENEYKTLTGKKLTPIQVCVFKDIFTQYQKIKKENYNYNYINIDKKKKSKYFEIKKKIIDYIASSNQDEKLPEKFLVYNFVYKNNFYNCYFDFQREIISKCKNITFKEYSENLSQSGINISKNEFSVYPINLGSLDMTNKIIEIKDNIETFDLDQEALYLLTNKNISNKTLNFIFKNQKSKLVINGNFKDVNFNFKSNYDFEKTNLTNIRYDHNLLTGCANFFKSKFSNVKIFSENMICEDSVNIKNSNGNLKKIEINNSFYDAIDFDFSKLNIDKLNINYAKNDCADFSFGKYFIEYSNVNKCGDKGLSIGEKSNVFLKDINVNNSKIGVASKDSSVTNIKKAKVNNSKFCLSAYKKKKEFEGSKITVDYLKCENYYQKVEKDSLSSVQIFNDYIVN